MSYDIHIAFWSNIWDRIFHINQSLDYLIKEGIIFDCISSSYYRSEPIDAGWLFYINTVIRAQTDLSANDLLIAVLNIENRFGRIRYWYHNSRTIDIDILLYWDERYIFQIYSLYHILECKKEPLYCIHSLKSIQIYIFPESEISKILQYQPINL